MILKKQRKHDFILGKLCLFSNEELSFNYSISTEYTYFVYVVSGEILLENFSDKIKIKTGTLFDYRKYGDIFFKITAGKIGSICLLIMTDVNDDYHYDLYNCNIIHDSTDIKKSNDSIIISLIESLQIEKNNKLIDIPNGFAATLQKNIKYSLRHNNESRNIALLIDK